MGAIGTVQAQTCSCNGNDQIRNNGNGSNATALQTALTGSTFCVSDAAGGWKWQEQHYSDGNLGDYKRGPSHATDPSRILGKWTVTGTNADTIVTHTYTAFGSSPQAYSFKVCQVSTLGQQDYFGFCPTGGGTVVMAKRIAGVSSPCQ